MRLAKVLVGARRHPLGLVLTGVLVAGSAAAATGHPARPDPVATTTVAASAPETTIGTEPPTTTEPRSAPSTESPPTLPGATTTPTTTEAPPTVVTTIAPVTALTRPPPPTVAPAGECDPNYAGACVPIAADVDCAGGSGNGPAYVRGPVEVIGNDIYGLDRDQDGTGCEGR
jgi:hypothetical protein